MKANKLDYGIRLYCIRLNDNKVVLLNGGIKTKKNPLDCPNVQKYFKQAKKIATMLDKAIINKEIDITKPLSLDKFEIEI